jgi:ubiquinone/menaquinone biosynthesis C-methylase UbiE
MTTNYDLIAAQYKRSKLQPWRTHIEACTLVDLVGEVAGQSVLDVACGEGFYARIVKAMGAARMMGVDLSSGMVELATRQEIESPLGIEYRVGDARELALDGQFDLVIAAYLLNYAPTRRELHQMCRGISQSLKPGGRFVTVNCNPGLDFTQAPSYRKYGFETRVLGEFGEGAPIQWSFYLPDGSFEIENYHLDAAAHEEALRLAGFRHVRWHPPRLSPQGLAEPGPDHWADFLKAPPIAFIEACK